MTGRLLVVALAATLCACTVHETQTVVAPPADNSCTSYGYVPGTTAYSICIEREAAARRRGRMASDYAYTSIVRDSQDACVSYGLTPGSERYERCVQREIDYRRPA